MSFRSAWSWFTGNAAAAAILVIESGLVVDYGGTMASLGLETLKPIGAVSARLTR